MWVYHESNKAGSMTQAEMENNATEVYNQLSQAGWTLNAVSGLLGNVQRESYINPAQWQIGYDIGSSNGGFGLVGWTPSTKYTNWATSSGYDKNDGSKQVLAIDQQPWGTEYYKTSSYPMTYEQFKVSTEAPEYLAEVFCYNYERAGVSAISERRQNAINWFNFLSGTTPPTPPDPPDPPKPSKSNKRKLPIYMMCRPRL